MSRNADLDLINLSKKYGDTVAVDDISLKIRSGTYCCLLGPSGCGKTTTLRMVAGHETVTSGDILLGLENVTDKRPAARGTAMMFQNYALFPHLKVRDNVAFSLKMRGADRVARTARAHCSSWSIWDALPIACRDSCPAASNSALPLPEHWSPTR